MGMLDLAKYKVGDTVEVEGIVKEYGDDYVRIENEGNTYTIRRTVPWEQRVIYGIGSAGRFRGRVTDFGHGLEQEGECFDYYLDEI